MLNTPIHEPSALHRRAKRPGWQQVRHGKELRAREAHSIPEFFLPSPCCGRGPSALHRRAKRPGWQQKKLALRISVLYFALCILPSAFAFGAPDALEPGQDLAAKLRAEVPVENSQTHGTLIVQGPNFSNQAPVVCEVKVLDGTWEIIYQSGPSARWAAERLVVIHGTNGPNRYLYARAAGPLAPLPDATPLGASGLGAPFAGSDFSLGDLGLDFLHWPQQTRLKGEMRLGQPCYVLESGNPAGNPIVRVKSYIDEQNGGLLVAEAYDKDGRMVKEFSLHGSSFKKVNGQWRLEKLEIRDRTRHSRTTLKFDIPNSIRN